MEIIVGLGSAGCKIADAFSDYAQYKIYKIAPHETPSDQSFKLPDHDHPERYEVENPALQEFLEKISGEVLFILSGASTSSGAALYVMSKMVERCKLSVLYVKPEVELLGETKTLQENLVRNVLQEYARSAAIERIYLVSNEVLSEIVGDSSVYDYHKNINALLSSTIHMINVLNHTDSVTDTYSPPKDTARISTYGIVDPITGTESLFFPIDEISEAKYYFSVPEDDLKEDVQLFRNIVKLVKGKISGRLKASYGIYRSVYKDKYAYLLCHSPTIQEK